MRLWEARPIASSAVRAGFLTLLFVLCLLPLLAGPLMQYTYAHDAFIFLDGGWRVLHGQRPQVDFSTNLGPIMLLYSAIGIQVAHALHQGGGHALSITHTLFGFTVAAFAYLICFRRLRVVPGMITCLLLIVLAMAPYNTGEFPFFLTSGMLYNRIGYALVGIVLIEALVSPEEGQKVREEWWGGAATGFLLAFLLFLKITYFLAAAFIVVGLLPCRPQHRSRLAGLVTAFAFTSLAILTYLRFDFHALIAEYTMSAKGKALVPSGLIGLWLANIEPTLLLFAFALAAALFSPARHRRSWHLPWAVLVVGAAGFEILMSNHQLFGNPILAILGLVLAERTLRFSNGNRAWAALGFGFLVPAIVLAIPTSTAYSFSILKSGIHWKGTTPEVRVRAPALNDMEIREEPPFFNESGRVMAKNYADFINDGFALLQSNSATNESVMSLDFSNPFSFGLQRPPQTGGTTCLQAGVTFSRKSYIAPARLIGDVRLVMWPKWFSDDSLPKLLRQLYGPTVAQQFHRVSETEYWTLYRRNG